MAQAADVVVQRGRGSYVFGTTGSRYLDVVTGYGVASLGHSHPRWVEAVIAQAHRLAVSPLHTAELAEYLTSLAGTLPPRLDRPALFSTGAEAVENALRLVQTATGRSGVLSFSKSFHGKTAAVRYTGDLAYSEAKALGPAWLRSGRFPACERHDAVTYAGCDESAADVLAELGARDDLEDVGAVIAEPVLGTAGNVPPKRPFLRELRRFCDERSWLMVLDESITGFGRTGRLFAFESFGVEPDVVVLSKGLGGGFPLSAVCASAELWDSSSLAAPSGTSSSYGGNPLACAAGLATLDIVTSEGFLADVREVGDHAGRRLIDLADASPAVARPRGIGLMLGFDLVDPDTGALATFERCEEVFRACRDLGILAALHVPRVRLSPPLTLSLQEANELFDVLNAVLG